jgi:hypothetical protein
MGRAAEFVTHSFRKVWLHARPLEPPQQRAWLPSRSEPSGAARVVSRLERPAEIFQDCSCGSRIQQRRVAERGAIGCATAGGGCTQCFLPGETESDDLSDDRGCACSDGELLLHSPRPCFTTVSRDTMDLLAESCRGYCDGPSAAYRPWGGCYVGGRMYDIHNGAEYFREEWPQTLS